jgi:multidrug resistance efflux pump
LEAFPRKEDLLTAEAALKSAEAELQLAKTKNERAQNLPDPRAISQEEKNRRQFEYQQAEAKLLQANADLAKTKEGTWKPDLEIARLEVEQAKASLAKLNAEIGQTMIRAPFDGTVLQIKVHAGESPPLDSFRTPLIIFGDIEEMHLRVSINQLDIPYFHPDAPAVAYLQGDARVKFPLHFVRVEPFLVNKQNLTNELTEIVNTRVLHIIYRIDKDHNRLFVGQQMDVFIETHYPS